MATFHKTVLTFNSLIAEQKFREALDFYDDDIVVADNLEAPVRGKAALRKQVDDFAENASVEAIEVVSLSSEDDISFTNWYFSFNHKTKGPFSGHRFSVQRWTNKKLSRSTIFTSKPAFVALNSYLNRIIKKAGPRAGFLLTPTLSGPLF